MEEDFRIYGDPYEEFREEMMRDSERGQGADAGRSPAGGI
jgi:hypothetical protein